MTLDVFVEKKDGSLWRVQAADEVLVTGDVPAQALRLNVFVDETLLWKTRGNGVVISTSAGKGDYSARASGIWMDPLAETVLLTPICCHNRSARPVVLSKKRVIRIFQSECDRMHGQLIIDGKYVVPIREEEKIIVSVSGDQKRSTETKNMDVLCCCIQRE